MVLESVHTIDKWKLSKIYIDYRKAVYTNVNVCLTERVF